MENSVAARRAERGLTQQELAELLGVSRQTVIAIERGKYLPSLPLAFRLAQAFEARIEDVFTPGEETRS